MFSGFCYIRGYGCGVRCVSDMAGGEGAPYRVGMGRMRFCPYRRGAGCDLNNRMDVIWHDDKRVKSDVREKRMLLAKEYGRCLQVY